MGLRTLNLASRMGMAICWSMLLCSSMGMVFKVVSTDRSCTTSSRDRLPLLLLDAAELRDHTGMVGTDEAHKWSLTGILESSGDESIDVMLRPSPVELDTPRDAGCGGVGGLPSSWLVLQSLGLTTGNCDATHENLGRLGLSWTLLGRRLYGRLSYLLVLMLALVVQGPLLAS